MIIKEKKEPVTAVNPINEEELKNYFKNELDSAKNMLLKLI